ncbi:DUF4873 domain-containing protein [Actinocatenispora rupis]|uniref:DUF4873 domain-containing protein n=1 Tax=Actinocatenispora rupis TaxID=519421 RepID=A0A8J3NF79_9ACTN|nr:DUF4873 domain-containing protein [Actinocatenispora rupis]GID14947.1 DUF4873 domain-containing protein [Actinocatenispora rupis]
MSDDGYRGPVTLAVSGRTVEAQAELRGAVEPISGRYRWYGRLSADAEIAELAGVRTRGITLTTPYGSVTTTLADADPWGRYRVGGEGSPPFPVLTEPPA